jgi:hypothetical protein
MSCNTATTVPPMSGDPHGGAHSLRVTLEKEEIYEGNNTLQMVVHNTAPVDYQRAVIRLEAPSGINLLPNKLELSSLLANSSGAVPFTLYVARPGVYQIGVRVSTFPAPKEGFLRTQLQVEALPRPESPSSLGPVPLSSADTGEASSHYHDTYSPYEIGLRKLLNRIGKHHPRYRDALTYQQRLQENIARSRKYGDTDTRNAERAEIIDQLNRLALSVLGITFNELCE